MEQTNKLNFVTEINETLANAIRRSLSEVPVLAVDEVEFYKNDSALYDEMVAHRIGLIPLKTDKTFNEQDKCTCKGKGCGKCTVELKLDVKGPVTVLAKDLKGKAEVVYEDTPIVLLTENQQLSLVAKARLGKGIEHSKYNAGLAHYRHLVEIEVDKSCDLCNECVKACPHNILKQDNKKITISNVDKCDECMACVEKCKKRGKDSIHITKTDKLVFFTESFGQIEPKRMISEAVSILKSNLADLSKAVK